MRKILSVILVLWCGAVAAQDLIVKTDASQIEARVLEISPESVRYKRFSNPDGPTYVLPVGEILRIRYANGETEDFAAKRPAAPARPMGPEGHPAGESVPLIPLEPALPAADREGRSDVPSHPAGPEGGAEVSDARSIAARPAPEYVVRTYAVGDLYDREGVKGVVCKVTDGGTHGLVLSLEQIYLSWSEFRKPDLRQVGAADRMDGEANMRIVGEYIEANGLSWSDFPAFAWCREQGEGWYLPSIDELLLIGHGYNGGSRTTNNRQARNRFNETLRNAGGSRMDRLVYYYSSTEMDAKRAYSSQMGLEPPYVVEIPKSAKFLVRAVHKF